MFNRSSYLPHPSWFQGPKHIISNLWLKTCSCRCDRAGPRAGFHVSTQRSCYCLSDLWSAMGRQKPWKPNATCFSQQTERHNPLLTSLKGLYLDVNHTGSFSWRTEAGPSHSTYLRKPIHERIVFNPNHPK